MKFRNAKLADINEILAIKKDLKISNFPSCMIEENDKNRMHHEGGFLLGTTREKYTEYIKKGLVKVADNGCILGFSVVMDDSSFKHYILEPVLTNHPPENIANLNIDITKVLQSKVAYFDQLAFIRNQTSRYSAPALALSSISSVMNSHSYILTTVVQEPLSNPAAIPMINRIGFQSIGTISEYDEMMGLIVSSIFCMSRTDYLDRIQQPFLTNLLRKNNIMCNERRLQNSSE